jgi:lipopolysaccharide transport system ATP-binding protein
LPTPSEAETPSISIEGLGKRYSIGEPGSEYSTLKEALTSSVRGLAASARALVRGGGRHRREHIWALRDVSFEVARGEAVAVIGPNGAGKSTVLKILSRITEPTEGRATIRGRVGSLLEVGTGFHPELTGRENTYLNGAIIGMTRREIARKFDEIVEFAEVSRFIDTPVKRYSSGMYLRLAFAVAAHLEPEILIVDEVLAVGDAAFQRKCMGKMGDVAQQGRTVLFVSHNMDAVQRLCSRGILLERGRVAAQGGIADVVARYLSARDVEAAPGEWLDLAEVSRSGSGEARFARVRYWSDDTGPAGNAYPRGRLNVEMEVDAEHPLKVESLAVAVWTAGGVKLVNADTVACGRYVLLRPGRNRIVLSIEELYLNPGTYRLGLWMASALGSAYDYVESAFRFDVLPAGTREFGITPAKDGLVPCTFDVDVDRVHSFP